MSLDEDHIELTDQRIRLALRRERAAGTCVSRDSTGPGVDVLFVGSTVAMPVKVLGTVFVQPGDRCVLEKWDTEWVVTGSWSSLGLGEASKTGFGQAGGATASLFTFVDYPGWQAVTFTKVYDGTFVRMGMTAAGYTNIAGSAGRFGVRLTPQDAGSSFPATDYNLTHIYWNDASKHLSNHFSFRQLGIPAGDYTVMLRHRRYSGSGNILSDDNDLFMIELDERVRYLSPVL